MITLSDQYYFCDPVKLLLFCCKTTLFLLSSLICITLGQSIIILNVHIQTLKLLALSNLGMILFFTYLLIIGTTYLRNALFAVICSFKFTH